MNKITTFNIQILSLQIKLTSVDYDKNNHIIRVIQWVMSSLILMSCNTDLMIEVFENNQMNQ